MGNPHQITRPSHGLDISFMDDALCASECHNRRIFFADSGRSANERAMVMEAKSVCMRCPVLAECFIYACEAEEHGVWGATTRDERLYYRSMGRLPPPRALRRKREVNNGSV